MTCPTGVDVAAWERGVARARAVLDSAPVGRQCTAKRCKRTNVTDLSGLCPRHLNLAADAARGRPLRPVFDPPTRPET